MGYAETLGGTRYVFADLKTLLARATPSRSGDRLAGIAAGNITERVAAQRALADLPLRRLIEDPVILGIAARVGKTPAQVLLAWAVQRGTALLTTPGTAARAKENFNISALPEGAFHEINGIQTRQRLNDVVKTGSPGFIPRVQST